MTPVVPQLYNFFLCIHRGGIVLKYIEPIRAGYIFLWSENGDREFFLTENCARVICWLHYNKI